MLVASQDRVPGISRTGRFCAALRFLWVAACAILIAGGLDDRPAAAQSQTLQIVSKTGTHTFTIELAKSDQERSRGLMFRRELPEGRGMLFDFQRDQEIAMWMENTYISLDMLFIRSDGRIHRIAEHTEPLSRRTIQSEGSVRFVLEVIAGTSRKLGIAPGDQVSHPIFNTR